MHGVRFSFPKKKKENLDKVQYLLNLIINEKENKIRIRKRLEKLLVMGWRNPLEKDFRSFRINV